MFGAAYPGVTAAARSMGFGPGANPGVCYFNDFLTSSRVDEGSDALGEWTITATNSAEPTTATDAPGGHLTVTNTGADNDMLQFQLNTESVKLGLGVKVDMCIRHKPVPSTSGQMDWLFGLAVKDTSLVVGASDVHLLRVDDGDTNLDFSHGKDVAGGARGSETSTVIDSSGFTASTWMTYWVSIVMDPVVAGSGRTTIWKYDVPSGVAISKLYDQIHSGICDNEEMTLSFAYMNGEAVASSGIVDYVGLWADVLRTST